MLALQRKDAAIATESFVFEPVAYPHPHSESEAYPKPEKVVSVLTVSPFEDDHVFLGNIFSHSKWHICGSGAGAMPSSTSPSIALRS